MRVVIAEDELLVLEGLRTILEERASEISVVGVAHDGEEAVRQVTMLSPDVVLMAVNMPKLDGVEAAHAILQKLPKTKIVMLTTIANEEYARRALNYGAVGYLLKDISPDELIQALRAIAEGLVLVSPVIGAKLARRTSSEPYAIESAPPDISQARPMFRSLSSREQEVLHLIALGLNNKEIAEKLFITTQTVKNHVSSIYEKIGARDRIQATLMAINAYIDS